MNTEIGLKSNGFEACLGCFGRGKITDLFASSEERLMSFTWRATCSTPGLKGLTISNSGLDTFVGLFKDNRAALGNECVIRSEVVLAKGNVRSLLLELTLALLHRSNFSSEKRNKHFYSRVMLMNTIRNRYFLLLRIAWHFNDSFGVLNRSSVERLAYKCLFVANEHAIEWPDMN